MQDDESGGDVISSEVGVQQARGYCDDNQNCDGQETCAEDADADGRIYNGNDRSCDCARQVSFVEAEFVCHRFPLFLPLNLIVTLL